MNNELSYATIYHSRNKSSMNTIRLHMTKYATKYSIAAATRYYEASRNTIRKWLRLYEHYRTLRIKESQKI